MRFITSVLRDVTDVTKPTRRDIFGLALLVLGLLGIFFMPGYPAEAAGSDQQVMMFTANLDKANAYAGYTSVSPVGINEEIFSSLGPVVPLSPIDSRPSIFGFDPISTEWGEFISYRLHFGHNYDPLVGVGWDQSGCKTGPLIYWYLTQEGYQVLMRNQSEQMLYLTSNGGDTWVEFPPKRQWTQNFTDWGQVYVRAGQSFEDPLCANLYWLENKPLRQKLEIPANLVIN